MGKNKDGPSWVAIFLRHWISVGVSSESLHYFLASPPPLLKKPFSLLYLWAYENVSHLLSSLFIWKPKKSSCQNIDHAALVKFAKFMWLLSNSRSSDLSRQWKEMKNAIVIEINDWTHYWQVFFCILRADRSYKNMRMWFCRDYFFSVSDSRLICAKPVDRCR